VLILGLLGGYQWLRSYLKSDDFRLFIGQRVSEELGIDAHFGPFRWNGLSVECPTFTAGKGAITADTIQAEFRLSGVKRGVWEIPHIRVETVSIHELPEAREDISSDSSTSTHQTGFLASLIPQKAELKDIIIPTFHANLDNQSLKGASIVAVAQTDQTGFDITLRDGSLKTGLPLFPNAKLSNAQIRLRHGDAYLTEATLTVHKTGRVELSGEKLANGQWSAGGTISKFDCVKILPQDWIKRLTGQISGTFSARTNQPIKGTFQITNGTLTALPVLDTLAAYTDVLRFRRLTLHTARCDYSVEGKTQTFSNIQLINKGLVALEGDLTITDRVLNGLFHMGVIPGTLTAIPGAEEKVFTTHRGGMIWTPVRITGTLDNPQEDLKDRLYQAAQERLFETIPESGQLVLKYSGEAATENAQRIIQESQKLLNDPTNPDQIIESGSNILEGGLNSIEKGVGNFLDVVPGGGIFRPNKDNKNQ